MWIEIKSRTKGEFLFSFVDKDAPTAFLTKELEEALIDAIRYFASDAPNASIADNIHASSANGIFASVKPICQPRESAGSKDGDINVSVKSEGPSEPDPEILSDADFEDLKTPSGDGEPRSCETPGSDGPVSLKAVDIAENPDETGESGEVNPEEPEREDLGEPDPEILSDADFEDLKTPSGDGELEDPEDLEGSETASSDEPKFYGYFGDPEKIRAVRPRRAPWTRRFHWGHPRWNNKIWSIRVDGDCPIGRCRGMKTTPRTKM